MQYYIYDPYTTLSSQAISAFIDTQEFTQAMGVLLTLIFFNSMGMSGQFFRFMNIYEHFWILLRKVIFYV